MHSRSPPLHTVRHFTVLCYRIRTVLLDRYIFSIEDLSRQTAQRMSLLMYICQLSFFKKSRTLLGSLGEAWEKLGWRGGEYLLLLLLLMGVWKIYIYIYMYIVYRYKMHLNIYKNTMNKFNKKKKKETVKKFFFKKFCFILPSIIRAMGGRVMVMWWMGQYSRTCVRYIRA